MFISVGKLKPPAGNPNTNGGEVVEKVSDVDVRLTSNAVTDVGLVLVVVTIAADSVTSDPIKVFC